MSLIHASAVIEEGAVLGENVSVGPFAYIGAKVKIGDNTTVAANAVIEGDTTIGKNNRIFSHAAVGTIPQDLKFNGEDVQLIIGDNNLIREYASIHRGTVKGGGKTIVGNNTMIMAYAHLGHDCLIGDHVIIVNAAHLGGHTEVADRATVGGLTGTHQFSRIGTLAFIGGGSAVSKDVPPFAMVTGERGQMRISGLNKVGLRRNGFSRECISQIEAAFRILFHSPELLHHEALDKVERDLGGCEEVDELVNFIRKSKRGVVKRTKTS